METIEQYYKTIKDQFSALIEREKVADRFGENTVHAFIEKHPLCLLGTVMNNKIDGYYLYGDCIFSKISFGTWERRVPDFIIITYNSVEVVFNFIEIEAPNRKIFNGQSDLTADFNHSFTQLEDWKRLFPTNSLEMERKMVASCFSDMGIYDGARAVKAKYILVYGSSDEYRKDEIKAQRLLEKFSNAGFHFMSYDRLIRQFVLERGIYTVKFNRESGGFKAVGWAPYLNYGINRRRSFGRLENKVMLANESTVLTDEQKGKLSEQILRLDPTPIDRLNAEYLGLDLMDSFEEFS